MTSPTAGAPYVLVVSLAPRDPMCTLFFTHIADRVPLRIVQYPVDDISGLLSGASAVVIIRGLFEFGNLIRCAKRLGVPCYYFQDDNFMLIRQEVGTYGSLYEKYTPARVRAELRGFAGVLLATPTLMQYFKAEKLHDALTLYPPVAGPVLTAPDRGGDHPVTVAFFGGLHRREPFIRYVFPAVCRLAQRHLVRLVAAGIEPGSLPPVDGVEVVYPSYDTSYTAALQLVARHGIDILVHPSTETANNIYKNPHVLINARAIGAAPIFTNTAPYDAVAGGQVAVLCENTEDAWCEALSRLAADVALRQGIQARLAAYCTAYFGGELNTGTINAMLRSHPAPSAVTRARRLVGGAVCLAAGHLRRRVGRMFRSALGQ